jgi:hypothetical protein
MTDERRLRTLSKRLALPERAPDEAFVARTRLALRARALAEAEGRVRRDQVLTDLAALAGLALAARRILPAGEETLALLAPLAAAAGTMAAAWAAASLILTVFAHRRPGAPAGPR